MRILLQLFEETVCLDDSLMQSFALDYHFAPVGRSEIGEMVYQAKYQSPKTDDVQNFTQCANDIAQMMCDFIAKHPVYGQADMIMSVPPTRQRKKFDLPAFLVRYIAEKAEIENISFCITKTRQTAPQKDMETLEEKYRNLQGAFQVTGDLDLAGKHIILVDDIYQSGATLHEVASTLQRHKAIPLGLVVTKTVGDMA